MILKLKSACMVIYVKYLIRIMYISDKLKIYPGLCVNSNKSEIVALGNHKARLAYSECVNKFNVHCNFLDFC